MIRKSVKPHYMTVQANTFFMLQITRLFLKIEIFTTKTILPWDEKGT